MTSDPDDEDSTDTDGYRDWSHDLDSLQEIGEEALKKWRAENPHSTRDYPTVRWLVKNGYAHLRWILREKHNMGTPEFFALFTSAGGSDGYEWDVKDPATTGEAERYLDDRVECRDWSLKTKQTNRSQLNEVLRRFADRYGEDCIIALADDPTLKTEVYETFKEVVKSLRSELSTDDVVHHYTRAGHRFFEALARSDRIAYDPMDGIEDEFNWSFETESSPFTEDQVKQLWIVAETDEERMLVIGYCVWGVRTKELARIHLNKINLDTDDPHIQFEEVDRKNGRGKVSLLFGLDTLANLVEKRKQDPDWNGYLFPSDQDRDFLCADQMRRRFKDLCRKAGVTVDGDMGTPKHGRAFYYDIQAEAETELLEMADKIAEEQGSQSAEDVRDSYLSEQQRRRFRRIIFRNRFRDILPDDINTNYSTDTDFDESLDDFE